MKHLFRVCLLSFVVLATIRAADPIKFSLDGNDWEMMPDVFSKGMYVQGLLDGLTQAAVTINRLPITQETLLESVKAVGLDQITPKKVAPLSQTVEAIDFFYSDARNAVVSIPFALRWVKVKLDGATPENLAGYASYLRTNSKQRRLPTK